mgnify:FL=1|jgi:hypothetical protein
MEAKPFEYTSSRGVTYYLYSHVTTLRNKQKHTIYFFSAKKGLKHKAEPAVPAGYQVKEVKRNGFVLLRKVLG